MKAGVLLRELWQSWRASLRKPGFVLLAGLTLALGVGFAAAFINLFMALNLPINAARPEQLVVLSPARGGWYSPIHERHFRLLQGLPGVASIGAISSDHKDVNFGASGHPVLASEVRVSRGYLVTLGARMVKGRYFSVAENRPHGSAAVILTHRFWRSHFNSEDVVGRSVLINGRSVPIVGVLGPNFETLGPSVDLIRPLQLDPAQGGTPNLIPVARLTEGSNATLLAAAATARVRATTTGHHDTQAPQTTYQAVALAKLSSPPGLFVLGQLLIAGLLLVLAANLSNLMLARAQQHQQDRALRAALGAASGRLLLPAWSDALLVIAVGCPAGMAIANAASHLVQAILDAQSRDAPILGPGTRVLFIVATLAVMVVIVSTTAASLRVRRDGSALQSLHGAAGAGPDRGASRNSRLLLVIQTMLATALVAVGMLFCAAALHASNAPRGYEVNDAYQFHLVLPRSRYPDIASRVQLMRGVIARLQGIPGVQSAGASDTRWFNDSEGLSFTTPGGHSAMAWAHWFAGNYPQALRVPTLRGRVLGAAGPEAQPLAWVSEAFAVRYLRGAVVGQHLELSGRDHRKIGMAVAGVVSDTFTAGDPHAPAVWLPITRSAASVSWMNLSSLYFVVRMQPGHDLSAAEVAIAVHGVAPGLAIGGLQALSAGAPYVVGSLWLFARLVLMLAVATLALAAIGLFAVTSVASSARLREFGVRLALGASPSRLLMLVLRGALLRTLIGLVLGSVLAVLLGLMARAVLRGLGASWMHPWSLVLTWAVLLATGLLAALPSALRAARTPPTVTLNESAQ